MPYLSSIPWVVTSFTHKKRDLATLVHPTAYELSWFLMAYACSICSQVYWWHDKYRPRKPKYFNRVHTGYEWNKYNQTHYDHDNPPPKIVQGYKFNIFYPALDMNGINTTRLIMTMITHRLKLFKATSSIYFTLILWINQKHQRTV